jgi:aspartate dehydrogenase
VLQGLFLLHLFFLPMAFVRACGRPLRIGLIGHGTIGSYVAKKLMDGKTLPGAKLAAVLISNKRPPPAEYVGDHTPLFTSDADEFFKADWDLAVEAAGQPVVFEHAQRCLGDYRRHFMLTSVGALCDDAFHDDLLATAKQSGTQLLIAAGALPGMDWASAAAFEGVEKAAITQTKRPEGWIGTPAEHMCDLKNLTHAATFFDGNARVAATEFPKNANISAAFALATVGLDKAEVKLVADPNIAGPVTQIDVKGAAGELSVMVKGRPAAGSQRTSKIVPLSVVKAIHNLSASEFIGV